MREDHHRFLMLLGGLPARLNVEQVAWVLNCQVHDVPVLVSAKMLRPLGNPPPNAVKFFATIELLELTKDKAWLTRATQAVTLYWRNQNLRKKSRIAREAQHGLASAVSLPQAERHPFAQTVSAA
jgi:hypothetical protein